MANRGPEFELVTGGTDADAPSKGAVALNLVRRQNALEVRKGFGQMAQFDTLLSSWIKFTDGYDSGIRKALGSSLIKTSWGARQIVTLVATTVGTSAMVDPAVSSYYSVVIYDMDGGGHWEEPLFRHTAGSGAFGSAGFNMLDWHGTFESDGAADYASFIRSAADVDDTGAAFFVEIEDILYFGNEDLGLYAYLPVKLRTSQRGNRRRQIPGQYANALDTGQTDVARPPYSEGCFVKLVTPAPPSAEQDAAYTYTDKTTYPEPSVATAVDNRLVVGVGRSVWISDPGAPQSIKVLNTVAIPTDEDITALAGLNGNVYAFTSSEVWFMELAPGDIVTTGRLVRISTGIGCAGPNAITKTKDSLTWVDSRGVHTLTGVAQIQTVSEPVDTFFTSELSNPLSTYFVTGGDALAASLTDPMPRSFWRYSDDMVSAAYNEKLDAVLFSFPSQNAMLVFAEGQWFVWSVESMADETAGGAAQVGAIENIKRPWVMADEEDIFVSCGVDTQVLGDSVLGSTYNTTNRSISILRYGRGGAVDRSVEDEDFRRGRGGYRHFANPGSTVNFAYDGGIYFHEPIPITPGEVFVGTPSVTIATPAYYVPVEIVLPYNSTNTSTGAATTGAVVALEQLSLTFTFDNTRWAPLLKVAATAEINALFPSERMMAATAFYGVMGGTFSAGARDFRVYSGASVSATGNKVVIEATAAAGTSAGAQFNICNYARSRLFWIPMVRKPGANANDYSFGMNIVPTLATVKDTRGTSNTCGLDAYVWSGAHMGSERSSSNSVAQPVDFAYKSGQIGMGDEAMHKLRGSYMRVLSHGKASAADRVQPNWPVGIINTATASDFKGWVSQVIDMAPPGDNAAKGVSSILDVDSIRTRYMGASSVLSKKVFASGSSADHVHYGHTNAGALTDVYLIDDEEVDVIATSDSVKGGKLTFMLWGMLRNKAERFAVESIKAVVRAAGGRRRGGR